MGHKLNIVNEQISCRFTPQSLIRELARIGRKCCGILGRHNESKGKLLLLFRRCFQELKALLGSFMAERFKKERKIHKYSNVFKWKLLVTFIGSRKDWISHSKASEKVAFFKYMVAREDVLMIHKLNSC